MQLVTDKNPAVLLVDDNSLSRAVLAKRMEQDGFAVRVALNCEQARAMARREVFDMVIVDDALDGEALRELLAEEFPLGGKPVVVLSAGNGKGLGSLDGVKILDRRRPFHDMYLDIRRMVEADQSHNMGRVLVVDDSEALRQLLVTELAKAGFRAAAAENGRKALEHLQACSEDTLPDLIVTDLNMPEMDGEEFFEELRRNKNFHTIPVLILSEQKNRGKMRQMLAQGACGYLCKPFNVDHVVVTAEKILSDVNRTLHRQRLQMEQERNMFLGSIMSLTQALEARDGYTRTHSDEVARISSIMAKGMGLTSREIERIMLAGRLHDIGKIGIPDHILLKPGRLTLEEHQVIQQHPTIARNILAPLQSLGDVLPAIASHHERVDGKGYPQGLKRGRIHLWARVLAVADTFNALTSHRPYRLSMDQDKALAIVEEAAGTQLCPDCVRVFLSNVDAITVTNHKPRTEGS